MRRIAPLLCAVAACVFAAPADAAPRATDFQRSLGTVGPTARAAAADRPWTSPVLRTKRAFSVVGLRWRDAGADVHAQIRVRDARGWHRWTAVPHAHSARGSDPIWAGRA